MNKFDFLKEIGEIYENIKDAEYNLSKMGIFCYKTLDEADKSDERVRKRDVTVEIGGPSTHIKFTILTRAEHIMIKNAIETIFVRRINEANQRLDEFCIERVKKQNRMRENEGVKHE